MTNPRPNTPLNPRQIEVIRLVAAGLNNIEIANRLVISPPTVLPHVENILMATGTRTRDELALYALRNGLLDEAN